MSHHFAELSGIAYLDNQKKLFQDLGYTGVQFYDIDGAQAYIVWNKERIAIVFRGTQPKEISDIKADIRFSKTNGYHRGFYTEYVKLHTILKDKVEDLLKKGERKVYICGHSLGGAMATICAAHYSSEAGSPFNTAIGRAQMELYTYGSPRVLSHERAKDFCVQHMRHVNNNDAVPRVPPSFIGYSHVGDLCYINFYGNIRTMTPWQRIKDQWRGRWHCIVQKKVPFDGLFDHSIKEYAKYLSDGE